MATVWTCLVRIQNGADARSHLIERTSFSIGRTEEADLPLTEPSVSRNHLRVEMRGQDLFVTDLKSGNGTTINGRKIEPGIAVAVSQHDVIKLGNAPQTFHVSVIPKPHELLNAEIKEKSLASSMNDISAQVEKRARELTEKEKVRAQMEAEKLLLDARKEAETIKTKALIDLQTKKQSLENEIASLRQEAEVAASTERLKHAKDADHYIVEAQKKIAKDYEEATEHIANQMRSAQEKAFSLLQDAEQRARKTLHEAQEESARMRLTATDEARQVHQEALKKHAASLVNLQESFHQEMEGKRQEIISAAKEDGARERARLLNEKANEIETLSKELVVIRSELDPLREKRETAVNELKELDAITTQARKELERNNKEVDSMRKMIARIDEVASQKSAAESALAVLQKRVEDAQKNIDREIEDMRSRSLLDFESSKKGQQTDLAKEKLKALEDVQKRIVEEEKRYHATRKMRVVELSQRISAKILPSLPELMADTGVAGARVKAAIEEATHDSLMNETSSFQAQTVSELAPASVSKEVLVRRHRRIAFAMVAATVIGFFFYGEKMYSYFKTQSNSYASEKVEQRREASVYYPEKSPLFGDTFRPTYTENVLYMRKYLDVKSDSLNQQKWLLRLNDLELLRPMGLTEDSMVAYTARENAMIERLSKLRSKINALYEAEGIKELERAERDDVEEIKRILKGDKNYQRIKALEEEFVRELIRST